jgi:hypothetical protein
LPNTYATELSLERRTVILKLHGQVDRGPEREWESFVVTEDDYIDYLADWNLRVIVNWSEQPLTYRSWAVQPEPMPLEREFWRRRDVELHELPFEQYLGILARYAGIDVAEATA